MKFKEYLQCDPRWGRVDYSTEGERTDICESGCGPSCMAMVLATWVDPEITPRETAEWSKRKGYKAFRQGTYYSYFQAQAGVYGLKAYQVNEKDMRTMKDSSEFHTKVIRELKKGNVVVACMGAGLWTRHGHYILLTDVDEGRDIAYVNDPASKDIRRTRGSWARLKKEVKFYFVVEKPTQKEGGKSMNQYDQPHSWVVKGWERMTRLKFYDGSRPTDPMTREESAVKDGRLLDYVEALIDKKIAEKMGGR